MIGAERIAAAPISWGICEVPGWGHQMSPERVFEEMHRIGLRASELGPPGFLPDDPAAVRAILGASSLSLVGAFVAAPLHVPERLETELTSLRRTATHLAASGGRMLVLAAASAADGYERAEDLDERGWTALVAGLDRARDIAAEAGLVATLHPHVGSVVESPAQIDELLGRSTIDLCLDTGHVLAGGGDPVRLSETAADRIAHVHLKDADLQLAEDVRERRIAYRDAVAAGLYPSLGEGDLDVEAVVGSLEAAGYEGWYVLEQDRVLEREPDPGTGPVHEVEASVRSLLAEEEARKGVLVTGGFHDHEVKGP